MLDALATTAYINFMLIIHLGSTLVNFIINLQIGMKL